MSSTSKQMKALVVSEPADPWRAHVQSKPVGKPEKGQILVKVFAIALNPSDWKAIGRSKGGETCGCDFCGVIQECGEGVKSLVKGDRVAGMAPGATTRDGGAFAEYLVTNDDLVWKVPKECGSEEAAAMGGGATWTTFQALSLRLGFGLPTSSPSPRARNETILIWAGATSVGMYAIQVAKLLGLKVITTASPKNWQTLKDFGADVCLDYRDEKVVEKIKSSCSDIKYGLDCISEYGSTTKVLESFSPEGGHLIVLLTLDFEDLKKKFPKVKTELILGYTFFGREINYGPYKIPALPGDRKAIAEWLNIMPQLVSSNSLRSNPLHKWEGGLEHITQGYTYLKEGKASCEKVDNAQLVFKIQDE